MLPREPFTKTTEQSEVIMEKQTPAWPSCRESLLKQTHETEVTLEQEILGQPTVKTKETISKDLPDIGFDKVTEADIPIQLGAEFSSPKDDRSLFPDIAPNTSVIKTTEQAKVIVEKTLLINLQELTFL